MGRHKALLRCGPGGETFVRRLAMALAGGGVDRVVVVGRRGDAALQAEVEGLPAAARYLENPDADAGQLSSLLAALAAVDRPGVTAILVTPVDAPLIEPATVSRLLGALRSTGAPIVRATYRGRHGHPVIFARTVFEDLRNADPSLGARAVVRAYADGVVDLDVNDPGVLGDVDTPDDYRTLLDGEL